MFAIISLIFGIYFWFIQNIFGQVCVETKMNWRDVPETFLYTYLEAYQKPDCLFWCTGTRIATAMGSRTVRREVAEQINVCCDGYVEEPSNTASSLHCKPVCSPSCINSYCKSPGICACNPGYLPNIYESHSCIPLCLKGCEHGICTAPNTCECEEGYENLDEICEPICFEPCDNGTCVAPDTCQCLPGYKKSDNVCEQYCSSYTANGECINTLTCEPGWAKVTKGSLEICEPICTEPCTNGTCVAPETCECLNGYEKSFNTCEPVCSHGCPKGRCVGPETCVCEPGWFIKESKGACMPHCDQACGNGICVAPNICECFPGYLFDESKLLQEHGSSLCVPVCENCEKICTDPENCSCPWLEIPIRVTATGIPCSESIDTCERTLCVMTTTTTTTSGSDTIEVNTSTTDAVISSTETLKSNTLSSSNANGYYELNIEKASWFHTNWFYGIGFILLTVSVVIIAATLKRKYCKSFESDMNGSKGDDVSAVVHYKQTSIP